MRSSDHMIYGQRDGGGLDGVRFARIERKEKVRDAGEIQVIASTDAAVDMGGMREILSHKADSIDYASARTVLFNHDRDQPIGQILGIEVRDGQMHARLRIREDAKAGNGVSLREAVADGDIEGISIGYAYSREDAEIDHDTRTITAHRWMLREISVTPTQADIGAKVTGRARAWLDEAHNERGPYPRKEQAMNFEKWLKARGLDPEKLTKESREALKKDFDADQKREVEAAERKAKEDADKKREAAKNDGKRDAGGDEASKAREIQEARERAERAEIRSEVHALCSRYGVDLGEQEIDDEFCKRFADKGDVARFVLERKAKDEATRYPTGGIMPASITHSQEDKAREAVTNSMLHRTGFAKPEEVDGNPMVGRTYREMAAKWGRMLGIRGIEDWTRKDVALFALGDYRNMTVEAQRDAANIINSTFSSFVTLDAITKIVARGFESPARGINYGLWSEMNLVPDFKSFNVGSMGTGNLQETAENAAFPELAKSEGVYSSEVKMWGGTLSLTLQALVNDDTGAFDRSLRQAGAIAQKTINKRAYQKLLRGTSQSSDSSTWTNNTTTGDIQHTTSDEAYGARAALDDVIAALMNKVGQDGNPLGTVPAFLLCAPGLAGQARGITGSVAPGQVTTQAPTAGEIQVIASPWLNSNSGLTGADSAHYYLLADPMEVTGMMVSMINDMTSPQVMEYGAGAVAARNWKIFQPFECDLVSQANSAGTTIIAAAQQGVD